MKPVNYNWIIVFSVFGAVSLALVAGVYMRSASVPPAPVLRTGLPQATSSEDAWGALLQITPVPYLTSLPEPVGTALDGTYARIVATPPQWWKCLRCADYRLMGGIWRLQFDKGVMRILYDVTGWHSLASYTVSGEQLKIFNDPYCPDEVGEYRWQLVDGALDLQVIEDACAFRLRGENLSSSMWADCPPPGGLAGGAYRPDNPPGCALDAAPQEVVAPIDPSLRVAVFIGDSRFYEVPPDIYAMANSAESPSPEGIQVAYSPESISMGLNRILWWGGEWIETSTDLPFTSMGVQFLGESQMGWARLLFDGQTIWQGDVSEIGEEKSRHGGYVQVYGFAPGRHTLRVESMGFDYRPVTVASFGFSLQDGVRAASP